MEQPASNALMVQEPKQCPECAKTDVFVDWWFNHKAQKEEVFVRCTKCGTLGEPGNDEAHAVELWNSQEHVKDQASNNQVVSF